MAAPATTEPDILLLASHASQATERILFKSRQKTFGEAFVADVYDDIIDIVPFIGDIIGSGPRLLDASAKQDKVAGSVRAANAALGAIPVLGFFLDLAFPASGIIKYTDYSDCINTGSTEEECMFPEGTVERDLMSISKQGA